MTSPKPVTVAAADPIGFGGSSDDDDVTDGNPMVAAFQEELSGSDDDVICYAADDDHFAAEASVDDVTAESHVDDVTSRETPPTDDYYNDDVTHEDDSFVDEDVIGDEDDLTGVGAAYDVTAAVVADGKRGSVGIEVNNAAGTKKTCENIFSETSNFRSDLCEK